MHEPPPVRIHEEGCWALVSVVSPRKKESSKEQARGCYKRKETILSVEATDIQNSSKAFTVIRNSALAKPWFIVPSSTLSTSTSSELFKKHFSNSHREWRNYLKLLLDCDGETIVERELDREQQFSQVKSHNIGAQIVRVIHYSLS
ncbi:hypothetical protein J6590_085452 [Homalodisca vitripennis]|nr:hypothetical protein J6590_085452 [Homalodisca vitripennis]